MNRQLYDMYKDETYETLYLDNIKTLQGGCSQNVVVKAVKASISITGDAPTMTLEPNKALITLTMRWNVNDWGGKDTKTRGYIEVSSPTQMLFYQAGNETTNMTGNSFTVTLPLDIVAANTTVKVRYEVVAFDGATWYVNTSVNYVDRNLVAYKTAAGSITTVTPTDGSSVVKDCTTIYVKYSIQLNHDKSSYIYLGATAIFIDQTKTADGIYEMSYIVPSSDTISGIKNTLTSLSSKRPDNVQQTITTTFRNYNYEDKTNPVHKSCSVLPTSIIIGDNITTTATVTGGNCNRNIKFDIYKNGAVCASSSTLTVIGNKSDQSWNITIPSATCLSPEGTYAIDVKMVLA